MPLFYFMTSYHLSIRRRGYDKYLKFSYSLFFRSMACQIPSVQRLGSPQVEKVIYLKPHSDVDLLSGIIFLQMLHVLY